MGSTLKELKWQACHFNSSKVYIYTNMNVLSPEEITELLSDPIVQTNRDSLSNIQKGSEILIAVTGFNQGQIRE